MVDSKGDVAGSDAAAAAATAWKIPFMQREQLPMQLDKTAINNPRPFKVICVGAGLSGIYAGIRIPRSLPGVELIIVDKNESFGGTWFENRYEGCACDIPAHCYQFGFEPNPSWSSFYAPAREICAYWESVALKYKVQDVTRFNQRVVKAEYSEDTSLWTVTIEDLTSRRQYEETANVLLQATGSLNSWKWPKVPGLDSFQGKLMHSAEWNDDFTFDNKRVALIGSGSTAIQIMPRLAPRVSQIDQYIRSPTWLGFPFLGEEIEARGKAAEEGNFTYEEEEKEEMRNDPQRLLAYRKRLMQSLNMVHQVTQLGSDMQAGARQAMQKNMEVKLNNKALSDFLIPPFAVGCRRLTPGPGFLEAFAKNNVQMVTTEISTIEPDGIVDATGKKREYDVIVCATGFDTSYTPRYPITGRGGASLSERWSKFPETYLSTSVDGFPNFFTVNGPNSAVGSGDLVILLQTEVDYVIKCMRKLRDEDYLSMEPSPDAVQEFQEYAQTYFRQTVFGTKCRTWYKAGNLEGPIYALWPGSSLHAVRTFMNPRWEDFHFRRNNTTPKGKNRFGYLGNGTTCEEEQAGDTAWYITEPNPASAHIGQVDASLVLRYAMLDQQRAA